MAEFRVTVESSQLLEAFIDASTQEEAWALAYTLDGAVFTEVDFHTGWVIDDVVEVKHD